VDPYEDSDASEKLKKWWQTYGNALILGIVLGSSALGGLKYWQHYTAKQTEAASQLYEQLLQNFQLRAAAKVDDTGNKLMQEYASTPYAGKAALVLAKMRFETNDHKTARQHLQWARDKAGEDAVRHVASLRLARLLLDQGELDAALELSNAKDRGGFDADYLELKGDILTAKGRTDEARAAYRAALEQLTKESPYQQVLAMKLDDLGPEATK
jgi:predicted negative regulator of RcsB-dependent stress response